MNWTEGTLSRHARPHHNEAAKQREHFARARTSGSSSLAALSSRSFPFLDTPTQRFQFPPPPSSYKMAEHRTLPTSQTQRTGSFLPSSLRTNAAPSKSAWSMGGGSKKRKVGEMTGLGETPAEMDNRIKRLLKSSNWVGLNSGKKGEFSRVHQEKKAPGTTEKVSPFFSISVPVRLNSSPTLPRHNIQKPVQPRVQIGNQSFMGTSECSPGISPSRYLSSESQMSPLPQPPSPELPRYQVSSSPASFHQPMPRRNLNILEKDVRDISSSSVAATCGQDRPSSAITSDPEVMEEWRSFLDLSSSVDPDRRVIRAASQCEVPLEATHSASCSNSQAMNTAQHTQPVPVPPTLYHSGASQFHRAPTPYNPPAAAQPYTTSSDSISQAFSSPIACVTGSNPHSVPSLAPPSAVSHPSAWSGLLQPISLTLSSTMELTQQPVPIPASPLLPISNQANAATDFLVSNPVTDATSVEISLFEDMATVETILLQDAKTVTDPDAYDAWLDFLFHDAVEEAEVITEAIQRASDWIAPSESVDSIAAVGGSAIASSTPIAQSTTGFDIALDDYVQLISDEFASVAEQVAIEVPSTDVQAASSSSGMFVQSTSPISATVATRVGSQDLDPTSDQAQATDSPKEASTADKTFRFSQPRLFVGRLSLASAPAPVAMGKRPRSVRVLSPETEDFGAASGAGVKKRKRLRRSKSKDGRPDIRSLPDFYDDPIEE